MALVKTYGIPRVVQSHELIPYNNGKGHITIDFTGGIPDEKYKIPATYSTASEFEQMVIELSPLFNTKIFRYDPNGKIITSPSKIAGGLKRGSKPLDETKTYKDVENLGQATEVLLELGAKADELTSTESIVSTMMKMGVSFPNLKAN